MAKTAIIRSNCRLSRGMTTSTLVIKHRSAVKIRRCNDVPGSAPRTEQSASQERAAGLASGASAKAPSDDGAVRRHRGSARSPDRSADWRRRAARAAPQDFQRARQKSRCKASWRQKNRVATAARQGHGTAVFRRNGPRISKTRHGSLLRERKIGSWTCPATNNETLMNRAMS